jgi:hypothetical protein
MIIVVPERKEKMMRGWSMWGTGRPASERQTKRETS